MIKLNDILNIDDFSDFRIRFILSWGNEIEQNPLERYRNDPDDPMRHYLWKGNKATGFKVGTKVIGLIRLAGDNWLLTHILEIKAVNDVPIGAALPTIDEQLNYWYNSEPMEKFTKFFGRVIVNFHNTSQNLIRRPETVIDAMEVVEILSNNFSDRDFPGYANVTITWSQLHQIISRNNREWRTALQNQKGIYLITDTHSGKQYVGSAYGEEMIWGRWQAYVLTGHGGNEALKKLPFEYIKQHFQYSILEIADGKSSDQYIFERENWWKQALLTRTFGYNMN